MGGQWGGEGGGVIQSRGPMAVDPEHPQFLQATGEGCGEYYAARRGFPKAFR